MGLVKNMAMLRIILQAIIDWNALKTVINSLFVNHIAIKKGKVKNYGN